MIRHFVLLLCVFAIYPIAYAQDNTVSENQKLLDDIQKVRDGEWQYQSFYTQVNSLPPEIGQLSTLKSLYISASNITELPPEIGQLINLEALYISARQLAELPPEIGNLTNLKRLHIDYSRLTGLPPEIEQLTSLEMLHISNSQLQALPPEIGKLTNLERLEVSRNALVALPPEIGQLTNLSKLNISYNRITHLPNELGLLSGNLFAAIYIGNPITYPSAEIRNQGQRAIFDFLLTEHERLVAEKIRLIIFSVGGISLPILFLMGLNLKQRNSRKPKKKRHVA